MGSTCRKTTSNSNRVGMVSWFLLLLLCPARVAVAADLYVVQAGSVVVVDETGTQIDPFASNFWGPGDVTVDLLGGVYVSDADNTVKRYRADGTYLGVFASGFSLPGGLAFDDSGVLYVAEDDFGDDEVFRFLPDGSPLSPIGAGVLNEPWGVAVDSAGRLYVLEDLGPIERFDSAGNYLGQFAVNPAQIARGIAIDSNDNVFVTSTAAGRIDKFAPDGTYLGLFASGVPGAWGIDVDENDHVYVAAHNTGTIEHFDPSGADLGSFTTGLTLPLGIRFATAAAPAGESDGLTVSPAGSGDLLLGWDPSCRAGDTDYAVYEGSLGSFSTHVDRTCSTGGATTWTLAPSAGNTYYLVVPTNGTREGSYGLDSSGAERGQGTAACVTQQVACP